METASIICGAGRKPLRVIPSRFQGDQDPRTDIREVITKAFALLLVEPSTFKQIVAGFNPKLDAHR